MTSVLWINLECRSTFVTLKFCSSVVLVVVAIQLSFSIAKKKRSCTCSKGSKDVHDFAN